MSTETILLPWVTLITWGLFIYHHRSSAVLGATDGKDVATANTQPPPSRWLLPVRFWRGCPQRTSWLHPTCWCRLAGRSLGRVGLYYEVRVHCNHTKSILGPLGHPSA